MNKPEVMGRGFLSTYDGAGVFKNQVKKIYADHGLDHIDPDAWYPLETAEAINRDIEAKIGAGFLLQVGKSIPENLILPPELDQFETAILFAVNAGFQQQHRNVQGEVKVLKENEHTLRVICDIPYPPKFNEGVLKGFANKYKAAVTIERTDSDVRGGEFLIGL